MVEEAVGAKGWKGNRCGSTGKKGMTRKRRQLRREKKYEGAGLPRGFVEEREPVTSNLRSGECTVGPEGQELSPKERL